MEHIAENGHGGQLRALRFGQGACIAGLQRKEDLLRHRLITNGVDADQASCRRQCDLVALIPQDCAHDSIAVSLPLLQVARQHHALSPKMASRLPDCSRRRPSGACPANNACTAKALYFSTVLRATARMRMSGCVQKSSCKMSAVTSLRVQVRHRAQCCTVCASGLATRKLRSKVS